MSCVYYEEGDCRIDDKELCEYKDKDKTKCDWFECGCYSFCDGCKYNLED